jgi:hypothetical protein
MKRIVLAFLALSFVFAPLAASAKIVGRLQVAVQSCVVNKGGNGLTNGINVVYYNVRRAPLAEVDFLVKYHGSQATLIDRGTFTQNAQVNHNITNALVSYPWVGPTPKLCTVQRVVLENGQVYE